jgi:hypothetical protein
MKYAAEHMHEQDALCVNYFTHSLQHYYMGLPI